MTIPAPVAYLLLPAGLALIVVGLWPSKEQDDWWKIWSWSFPDNLYFIFPGMWLVAAGLDFAIFGLLPTWGK